MNLQIINGCAGTDPGIQTAVTNPGQRYYYMHDICKMQYFGWCFKLQSFRSFKRNASDFKQMTYFLQFELLLPSLAGVVIVLQSADAIFCNAN